MRSSMLVLAFTLISTSTQAQDTLSSWKVRELVSANQAKHYDQETETFAKEKALAELNGYLTADAFTLSDFDKVQVYTAMARVEATQAGCTNDLDAARGYMKKALTIADGRISSDALWCALNISNSKRLSDRGDAYIGEASHYLFREALRRLSDEELQRIMLRPVGEKPNVDKMVANEMHVFRSRASTIDHVAKSKFNRDINSVADGYWFLLLLRGDVDSEGGTLLQNASVDKSLHRRP